MDRQLLRRLVVRNSGRTRHVVRDSRGNRIIGVGINLDSPDNRARIEALGLAFERVLSGKQDLSDQQIDALLDSSLNESIVSAGRLISNFEQIPAPIQTVLVDMVFDLGAPKFREFKKTIQAVEQRDWARAADEMESSLWFVQVGGRAVRTVNTVRSFVVVSDLLNNPNTTFFSLSVLEDVIGANPITESLRTSVAGTLGGYLPARLNEKEFDFLKEHPIDSLRGGWAALGASMRAEREYPTSFANSGRGDAMRHCYWAARMARDLGQETAEEILANHEEGTNDPQDVNNNAVGVGIGVEGAAFGNDQLWHACAKAADNGRLIFVGGPAPQPEPHSTPVVKPEPKPSPEPQPSPDPFDKPVPEPKPTPTPEPKPEPDPEPKPDPEPEPDPEPKPEPDSEPEPSPGPNHGEDDVPPILG